MSNLRRTIDALVLCGVVIFSLVCIVRTTSKELFAGAPNRYLQSTPITDQVITVDSLNKHLRIKNFSKNDEDDAAEILADETTQQSLESDIKQGSSSAATKTESSLTTRRQQEENNCPQPIRGTICTEMVEAVNEVSPLTCPNESDRNTIYVDRSDQRCAAIGFNCEEDAVPFFQIGCGCGCKHPLGCPDASDPNVEYLERSDEKCATIQFACGDAVAFYQTGCGCGCKPVADEYSIVSSTSVENRPIEIREYLFESSASQSVAVASPLVEPQRSRVFAFHEPNRKEGSEANDQILMDAWMSAWSAKGYEPAILTIEDAEKYANFSEYADTIDAIIADSKHHRGESHRRNCYLRYLAMTVVGGGMMVDLDVMPTEVMSDELIVPSKFTMYCGMANAADSKSLLSVNTQYGLPCAAVGSRSQWEHASKMVSWLANHHKETTSWNDMDSLLYLKPFNDIDFLEELRVYSSRTRPIQECSFRLE